MINVESYLSKQLSGSRTKTVVEGISAAFNRFWDYLVYLKNIGIESAYEAELDLIGTIMGYTWPLVPNNIILDKLLTFTSDIAIPSFSETGFSGTGVDGGNFSSLDPLDSNRMPIAQYKQVLEAIAKYKWGKFSLLSIDAISQIFHATYDLYTDENGDISVVYKGLNQGGCVAYYPALGLSPYPDDPAGTTYIQDAWATVDGWSTTRCSIEVITTPGKLRVVATGASPAINKNFTGVTGKTIRCKITKISSSATNMHFADTGTGGWTVSKSYDGLAEKIFDIVPGGDTFASIYLGDTGSASGDIYEVDFVYIGTGKYLDGSLANVISDSYDATIYGCTPDGAGGLIFDGINDYVEIPSPWAVDSVSKDITLCAVINVPSAALALTYPIFDTWRVYGTKKGFILRLATDKRLEFYNPQSGADKGNTIGSALSTGIHIILAVLSDGQPAKFYDNGVLIGYGNSLPILHTGAPLWIGKSIINNGYANNVISNPRWFPRALTAQQVQDSINDPVGLKISNTNLYLVNRVFTDLFNTAPRVVATRI